MAPLQDDQIVNNCNDLLIHKKFDECLNICKGCLSELKNRTEMPRAGELTESFCILTIQALAELNRWQEVVPTVTEQYNGIEDCPEKIIQACILLHYAVQDHSTCSVLANIWLRNPANFSRPEYILVLDTYLFRVLYPLGRWDEMQAVVGVCKGLDSCVVETYKQQIKLLKDQKELETIQTLAAESKPKTDNKDAKQRSPEEKNKLSLFFTKINGLWRRVWQYLRRLISWLMVTAQNPALLVMHIDKVALCVVIFYLLITHGNTGQSQQGVLVNTWSGFSRLWSAMFYPLHRVQTT